MSVDTDDCAQTFEQVCEELRRVEEDLARKLNLKRRPVRRELLALDRQGKLVENELVARWHELYAVYADWVRWESWSNPPPKQAPEEAPADRTEQGAAGEAALSFFVRVCSRRLRRAVAWLWIRSRNATYGDSFRVS